MPLSSSVLQPGESKYTEFQMIFGALMDIIRNCRNGALVMQLIKEHLFVDKAHIFMEEITQALNDFVNSLDLSQARVILQEILLSVENGSHGKDPASLQIQRSMVHKFGVCVLVRLADLDRRVATEVFSDKCNFFLTCMKACNLESLAEISKMVCALNLLMTFYRALDYNSDIKRYVHEAYTASDNEKNMHYTQLVMKALVKIRKETRSLDLLTNCAEGIKDDMAVAFREFHQMVQSTFVTVVRRTQDKPSFVDLVFKDCVWEHFVDTKTCIKMEVQQNFRRNFDSLTELRSRRGQSHGRNSQYVSTVFADSYASLGNLTLEIGGLSSLFGANSDKKAEEVGSTSEGIWLENVFLDQDEVNDNPVMLHFVLLLDKIYEKSFYRNQQGSSPVWIKELRNALEDVNPELERKNPCNVRLFAAKILINGTIRHPDMFRDHARDFFPAFFDKEFGLAVWLSKQGETLGKIPGSFNSYLREVCIMWNSWMFPPDSVDHGFNLESSKEIELAWNFVLILMQISPHFETAVAKSNVEYLSTFVQKWRRQARAQDLLNVVKVIKRFLSLSVSKQDENNMDACKRVEVCNATGIQLLNLFLVQELNEIERDAPLHPLIPIDIGELSSVFDTLLSKYIVPAASSNKENRKHRAKRLLRPVSQVCGHILACIEHSSTTHEQREELKKLKDSLKEQIRSLRSANQLDQALIAASSIVQTNPSLGCLFYQLAVENLVKLHGDFQCMVLGIIIGYVHWLCKEAINSKQGSPADFAQKIGEIQDQAIRLWSDVSRVFVKLVEKQDEKMQLLALQLVTGRDTDGERRFTQESESREGLLAFLTVTDICGKIPNFLQIVNSIFSAHRSESCRFHFYLMLMDLHEIWPSEVINPKIPVIENLHQCLVSGLTDPSERIQYRVLSWWNSRGVSKMPCARLLDLCERMRSSDGLKFDWASSSAWLLLSACKQVSGEMLFDRPLMEIKFKNVKIPTNFSSLGATMAPMFAGSLPMSSQQSSQMFRFSQSIGSSIQDGVVSTQVLDDFSQGEAVNASDYMENQTQLPNNDLFINRRRVVTGLGKADSILKKPLRKRVTSVDMADSQKLQFARRHEEQTAYKQRIREERANRVHLLRQYRTGSFCHPFLVCRMHCLPPFPPCLPLLASCSPFLSFLAFVISYVFDSGEVPDIQIKREDIMKPLQRLVLLDSSVAKAVIVQLVKSIGGNGSDWDVRVAAHLNQGETLDVYKTKLKDQIVSALMQRATASADVVEALLGIAQCFAINLPAKAGGTKTHFALKILFYYS
jgi:hypothetical protein